MGGSGSEKGRKIASKGFQRTGVSAMIRPGNLPKTEIRRSGGSFKKKKKGENY